MHLVTHTIYILACEAYVQLHLTLSRNQDQEIKICIENMHGSRGGGGGGGGGEQEVQNPLKNHKNIGFLSNTGPDPLKNLKAT